MLLDRQERDSLDVLRVRVVRLYATMLGDKASIAATCWRW